MQNKCKHLMIQGLGLQEVPLDNPIMLYNCIDCKSTITIQNEDYLLYAVNSMWYGIKKKKKD